MAVSSVYRDTLAFAIEARKGVLPVAVDIVAGIAMMKLPGGIISPKMRWVISAVPACVVMYLVSGFPRLEAGSMFAYWTYVIYKAWAFQNQHVVVNRSINLVTQE